PEAASVVISDDVVTKAYREIYARFDDDERFVATLQLNHLDTEQLRSALYRECKVNAILEKVAARSPKVSEVEIGIYYHAHPEKFHRPEQRALRHILITINMDYPENDKEHAWQRMRD